MNILIITPFYQQDRNIASVRWTNIAQRLAKNHNIIIATQPLDNDMDMTFTKKKEDGILVARLNQKTAYEKLAVKYFHGATGDDWQTTGKTNPPEAEQQKESLQRKIKNAVLYASMQAKAKAYARQICRDVIPKGMKIDVVISSACPFIEMLFGYEVKKRLGCKWICDFRDLPYNDDKCDDTHRIKAIMLETLPFADGVTVVAKGMTDFLNREIMYPREKIFLVTNGFSLSDKRQNTPISDGVLRIVHTGSLYGEQRSPDLLFAAIRKLKNENPQLAISVECAGGNNTNFFTAADKYDLREIVHDHGFLPRNDALILQNKADCLLAIVFNQPGGALGGKIFEYMVCNKPVIAITCGHMANSELTNMVNDLHLGIAVEEANRQDDLNRLADYLRTQTEYKCRDEKVLFSPDREKMRLFNHDSISAQVEKICASVV